MKVQSTFSERIARIESRTTFGGSDAYVRDDLVHEAKPQRKLHWDMLFAGSMAGGIAGFMFATQIGLLVLVSLDVTALYGMILSNYVQAGVLAGVALAPVGFVMSQIFARKNPRGWQFWIGYLAAVLGTNGTDIQTYYHVLTAAPA